MDDTSMSRASAAHAARLDRTIKDLQSRIEQQEAALAKLRASSKSIAPEPSDEPADRLQQLRTLTRTYESLTPKEPYLPFPESPLPSILALRNTHQTVQETKISLAQTQADLIKAEQRLEKEQADLNDANSIKESLESRIRALHGEKQERTQRSPSQVAKDMIRELKNKQAHYESETGKMVRSFNKFIDSHLAAMLAAEELGGPVVGEILDVDEMDLEMGYTNQGKAKKNKGMASEDGRQQRIDEIWGDNSTGDRKGKEPRDERRAAASEMKELTEQLLNNLVESEGGSGDAYVDLQEESAVARFLVRAKVAQFHPKDARRLRLIDFGRELDD